MCLLSQLPLVEVPVSHPGWIKGPKGGWVRVTEENKSAPVYESRPVQVTVTSMNLIKWFHNNGFPYARLIRMGSSEIIIELDHKYNIWKTLQNI